MSTKPGESHLTPITLAAPTGQMRRIQAFTAQQCPHLAGLMTGIGFLKNLLLVGGTKGPTLRLGYDFRRLGYRRGDRAIDDFRIFQVPV